METTVPSVKSLLVRARISLAEAAEARKLSCEEVRLELGEVAEGLTKLEHSPRRRHVRGCERCALLQEAAQGEQPRARRDPARRPAADRSRSCSSPSSARPPPPAAPTSPAAPARRVGAGAGSRLPVQQPRGRKRRGRPAHRGRRSARHEGGRRPRRGGDRHRRRRRRRPRRLHHSHHHQHTQAALASAAPVAPVVSTRPSSRPAPERRSPARHDAIVRRHRAGAASSPPRRPRSKAAKAARHVTVTAPAASTPTPTAVP